MSHFMKLLFPRWYAGRMRARAEAQVYEQWLEAKPAGNADDDWIPLGVTTQKSPGADALSLEQLRSRSRELVNYHPHAAAALRVFVNFVAGEGIHVSPTTGDPDFNVKAEKIWSMWVKRTGFDRRFREMVRRSFRDGECFLRRFITNNGVELRFVDPELVAAPQSLATKHPNGIRFDDDAETPMEYFIQNSQINQTKAIAYDRVDAADILHIKCGVDANVARGIPLLTPVLVRLKAYDNWLETMITLHRVRCNVVLIKKYTNSSPSEILSQASRQSSSTTYAADGAPQRKQKFEPGSIISTSAGIEYEMLSPNIQASDADVLGRAILLSIAAGLGISETMLTADSNNVNYASSAVAETPAFMEFKDQQRVFCSEIQSIYRWVIEQAISRGKLTGTIPDDPYAVDIQPSPMPTRDLRTQAQAWSDLLDRGVLSKTYVRRQLGLDPDAVDQQVQHEKQQLGVKA